MKHMVGTWVLLRGITIALIVTNPPWRDLLTISRRGNKSITPQALTCTSQLCYMHKPYRWDHFKLWLHPRRTKVLIIEGRPAYIYHVLRQSTTQMFILHANFIPTILLMGRQEREQVKYPWLFSGLLSIHWSCFRISILVTSVRSAFTLVCYFKLGRVGFLEMKNVRPGGLLYWQIVGSVLVPSVFKCLTWVSWLTQSYLPKVLSRQSWQVFLTNLTSNCIPSALCDTNRSQI